MIEGITATGLAVLAALTVGFLIGVAFTVGWFYGNRSRGG